MMQYRLVRHVFIAAAAAIVLPSSTQVLQGQSGAVGQGASIQSLAEPGESLAIKSTARDTGFVTFASTPGKGLLVPQASSSPAEERALGFVDLYGAPFGLSHRSQLRAVRAPHVDELGLEHVRFQQVHNGVPVTAAEFVVHLNRSRVTAANGIIVRDLPDDLVPGITAGDAQEAARQMIAKYRPADAQNASYSDPRLEIFNKGVLQIGTYPSRLAWFVEASDVALREYVWVDAQTGAILMHFSQLADALSRKVYTAGESTTLPGTLLRTEGGAATGDPDADNAYLYAGVTYNYYFTNHNRDSFDNAGATLISTVHGCVSGQPCPMQNAFWNGTQMVYGTTYASADDVVGHELTHAVTERSAALLYYNQSGALNESFSDIFGETIDQLNSLGGGNDTLAARWLIGEDLPIGAIRNMMNPGVYGDPAKVLGDPNFKCVEDAWTNQFGDRGGVHSNSGVPNHAYALMVDGGTYNGQIISGIGLTKAAKIEYRALTVYLTSGSGFLDDFNALNQACTDLIGTVGITSVDCAQVNKALLAVQMNATVPCAGAVAAPALCPTGGTPTFVFQDGFESATGNWSASSSGAGVWSAFDTGFAKTGTHIASGSDAPSTSDSKLAMTSSVAVPTGGRLYFDSAYEFENDGGVGYYDGGRLEYSINGGATWIDANTLIDGGRAYSGAISPTDGSIIAGQQAFVGSSFGYTGTRLTLASLVGNSVRFRFRIVSDANVGSLGWIVDNFGIYACQTATAPVVTQQPASVTVAAGTPAAFSAAASGNPTPSVQWQVSVGGGAFSNIAGATASTYSFITASSDSGKSFRAVFSNSAGTATTNAATLTVTGGPTVGSLDVTLGGLPGGTSALLAITGPNGFSTTRSTLTGTGFTLSDVAAGTYTVTPPTVSASGTYTAAPQSANVPAGGTATITITYSLQAGSPGSIPGDFDGDAKSDMALYKANGDWAILKSTGAFMSSLVKSWGGTGYTPVMGDYDGDGKQDLALYRGSTGDWLVLKSSSNYTASLNMNWGGAGYVPVPGDYDGDGKADLAVYQVNTGLWLILKSSSGYTTALNVNWGGAGYTPVPGQDFDGDHKTDAALYQPSTGKWLILKSSTGFTGVLNLNWGGPGYTLVPGDYDGDGKADLGLYQRSTGAWSVLLSGASYTTAISKSWGGVGYLPVLGDFDGDGKGDLGIFQPSSGNWYVLKSSTNFASSLSATGWGAPGDKLVNAAIAIGGSDLLRAGDFDGDGRSDITAHNLGTGLWTTLTSSTGFAGVTNRSWGGAGYQIVPGDYDGDGKADYAIYNPVTGDWLVLLSTTNFTTTLTKNAGGTDWMPVPGDYDGDGKTDFVVYKPATGQWFGLKSSTNYTTTLSVTYGGGTSWAPVPADFDGDGATDIGVYNYSTGAWSVLLSSTAYTTSLSKNAGGSIYNPVPADYDGDGKADLVVYNAVNGQWYGLLSASNYAPTLNVSWGGTGYNPVKGDFDGDGKADLAIYQGSTGNWYVLLSTSGYTTSLSRNLGGTGYVSVPQM